jgi:hypothetical protein
VLLGTPLQASLSPHLLNVLVQIANKQGLQKKKKFICANVCLYKLAFCRMNIQDMKKFSHLLYHGNRSRGPGSIAGAIKISEK